jgi:hypothetical protein
MGQFMWVPVVLAGALFLTGCGQKAKPAGETVAGAGDPSASARELPVTDYAAIAGYSADWHVSPGWPGEYPAGFVVLDKNVQVMGRAKPNPAAAQTVSCALPQLANYQLWNNARVSADKVDFFVATRTAPVTFSQEASVEIATDAGEETLAFKKGDKLIYLRYLGEGYTVLSFNGTEYTINHADLTDITDIDALEHKEDLWVQVTCAGGGQSWLLYEEVIKAPGIAPSPITGYGEAADLVASEVDQVRSDFEAQKTYENEQPGAAAPADAGPDVIPQPDATPAAEPVTDVPL